jgi:hypothetical protein
MKTTRKRLAAAIAAVAAAAVAMLTAVTPASASTYELQNVYISPASSGALLMLDVSGASQSPGAQVIQYWLHANNANQKWDFQQMPNGTKQIINANSGQCLTTDGIAGDGVYQQPCSDALNQEWFTDFQVDLSSYTIQSPSSGLYLDVYGASRWPGAVIDTWYYNGGSNQYFTGWQG